MDRVTKALIEIIADICGSNFKISKYLNVCIINKLENLLPNIIVDEYMFPIYCWVDEQARSLNRDSHLVFDYYNVTGFGQEFYKRYENIPLENKNLKKVYEVMIFSGFNGNRIYRQEVMAQIKFLNIKISGNAEVWVIFFLLLISTSLLCYTQFYY
jgi:hypothetical protein